MICFFQKLRNVEVLIFSQSISLTQCVVLFVCLSVCSRQLHSGCATSQLGDTLTTAPLEPLFVAVQLQSIKIQLRVLDDTIAVVVVVVDVVVVVLVVFLDVVVGVVIVAVFVVVVVFVNEDDDIVYFCCCFIPGTFLLMFGQNRFSNQ